MDTDGTAKFDSLTKNSCSCWVKISRFSATLNEVTNQKFDEIIPSNTKKNQNLTYRQFLTFCEKRNYTLDAENSNKRLAFILKNWAFNMRKIDGSDYMESANLGYLN